jgi:hypothetical protein
MASNVNILEISQSKLKTFLGNESGAQVGSFGHTRLSQNISCKCTFETVPPCFVCSDISSKVLLTKIVKHTL